jgi:hypothetical protein
MGESTEAPIIHRLLCGGNTHCVLVRDIYAYCGRGSTANPIVTHSTDIDRPDHICSAFTIRSNFAYTRKIHE